LPLSERCSSLLVRVVTCPRPTVLAVAGACALFRPAKAVRPRCRAEVRPALMDTGDFQSQNRALDRLVAGACHRVLDCAAMLLFCLFTAHSPGRFGSGGNGEPEGGAGAHAKRAPPEGAPICFFRAPPRVGSLLDLLSIFRAAARPALVDPHPRRRWTWSRTSPTRRPQTCTCGGARPQTIGSWALVNTFATSFTWGRCLRVCACARANPKP
jgi:hypothetical protein